MKYNKISPSDRMRVVDAFNNEEDWKSLCKTLGINVKTASTWFEKKVEIPKKKGGKISKKSPEIIASLLAKIEENASTTLLELKTLVFRDFNLDVTINTIKNWLDAELISVKNIIGKIVNMNSPENKVKRANYITEFFQHRAEGRTFVWIDETNFNLYCKRKEGCSKVGTRASIVMPACKGANLLCIGAMTTTNLVRFTTKRGAFKSPDCIEWFTELIEACAEQGIVNPTLVIDNAPVHSRLERLTCGSSKRENFASCA